jgi:membrane protein DedA with SNARE-associated domain
MEAATFAQLVAWVIAHGYPLFFVVAFFDGPIETAAAGVACALGYFNIYIIILLAVLGDLAADTVCYAIGYYGRGTFIDKYGHYIGLTPDRITRIEKLLHKNTVSTMIFVKLSPLIPIPGLITIGMAKVPLKKFAFVSFMIALPKSIMFALFGYLSGKAYSHVSTLVTQSQYVMYGVIALIVIVFFIYQHFTKVLTEKEGIK